jgi:hypothetical protein
MTKGDATIEHAAERLEGAAQKRAGSSGLQGKLAGEFAEDAAFLRKLKPSLIKARARGQHTAPSAPSAPQLPPRPAPAGKKIGSKRGGPNPFVVMGAAFGAGSAIAKWLDWRGHAHPRG